MLEKLKHIPILSLSLGVLVLGNCKKEADHAPTAAATAPAAENKVDDEPMVDTPVKSDKATLLSQTETYAVFIDRPEELTSGKEERFSIFVEPAEGWKMNREFPSKLKSIENESLTVQISDESVVIEKAASYHAAVTAKAPGESTLEFDLRFAVCTETTCDPKRETLKLPIIAKAGI